MYLDDEIQARLRSMGKISLNEVIIKEGDLYVALDVITKARRIVNIEKNIEETLNKQKRKILKG